MKGSVGDTKELLRGVNASAWESYYRTSVSRYTLFIVVVVVLLSISVVGVLRGGLFGIVLALGGAFGLLLVSIWLCLR